MSRRVLLAQPSPTLQMLIRMTLGAERLSVESVSEGRAALTSAREDPPDLVIADAALPGLDGFALAEALRGDPDTASVPILLLQPDWERPDMERMLHVGIQDVLTRPFEQHDLLERVRGLIGGSEERSDRSKTPLFTPAPPSSASPTVARVDEGAVARTLEARLPDLVDRAVAERLDALVGARLGEAIDAAVERALPEALADAKEALGRKADGAVEAAAERELRRVLEARSRELLAPIAEPVVWKVVPELAEDLIREEIRRLTEEGDP